MIVGIVVFYYIGRHPMLISLLFDFRILLFGIFIFFGIKEYKDRYSLGVFHFWQGLSIGILIYVTMSFIASLFIWVFGEFIEPQFVSTYIEMSTEQLLNQEEVLKETVGEERFNSAMESLPKTRSIDLSFDYFLKSMPIGLFLTLILSILTRTQPNRK